MPVVSCPLTAGGTGRRTWRRALTVEDDGEGRFDRPKKKNSSGVYEFLPPSRGVTIDTPTNTSAKTFVTEDSVHKSPTPRPEVAPGLPRMTPSQGSPIHSPSALCVSTRPVGVGGGGGRPGGTRRPSHTGTPRVPSRTPHTGLVNRRTEVDTYATPTFRRVPEDRRRRRMGTRVSQRGEDRRSTSHSSSLPGSPGSTYY